MHVAFLQHLFSSVQNDSLKNTQPMQAFRRERTISVVMSEVDTEVYIECIDVYRN